MSMAFGIHVKDEARDVTYCQTVLNCGCLRDLTVLSAVCKLFLWAENKGEAANWNE